MAKSFKNRLRIPIVGNDKLTFYSKEGTLLARGYSRVVIGGRGPYIEFLPHHIFLEEFIIPTSEEYRVKSNVVFYVEYRSNDESNVMLYFQKRKVAYADYKIGLYYISPFELETWNNQPTII